MSSPRTALRDYWPDLVYGLTDVPMIVDYLYRDRVITAETMEALHREPDPEEKIRRLLTHVKKRSRSGAHNAFTKFLVALEESDNGHFADLLRKATRIPAPSPRQQRSLSQTVPPPRTAPPVTRAASESALTSAQTPSTNTTAEWRESSSSSDTDVFSTGITYTGSGDERQASPPVTAPSQPASLTGTGARPKQRPPGTRERRESSSSSDTDVFSTGITYTGSGDERQGLERKEKAGEDRRLGRRETTPEATSTANLPGLRSDVTRTLSDVTAQLSLSDQASAAPCLGAPRPAISRQAAPLPAASRIAASRPAASPPLSAPQVPALPSPLPRNVRYTTKRGPVCVVGPELRKRFLFSSGVKLSGPARLAYHAGTDRLYVACCGNRQVVVCDTRGENARVLCAVTWPRDVSVSGDGERVYVAGISFLHILTASGRLVRKVTSVPGGKLGSCWAVTCYQQQVAVLAGEPDRVVIFSRDGEHVRTWSLDDVEGVGMAVDGDGRLYITDYNTDAVIVYSWEGEFRERFGEVDMEDHWSPGICVDGDGHVCVSRAQRVDVYGPHRRFLTSLGGEEGDAPGQFRCPHGLCLLPDGRLVVSDHCNDRLQIF